jgi:hypothetical protein
VRTKVLRPVLLIAESLWLANDEQIDLAFNGIKKLIVTANKGEYPCNFFSLLATIEKFL